MFKARVKKAVGAKRQECVRKCSICCSFIGQRKEDLLLRAWMVTVYENISSSEKKNYQVVLVFLNLESTYLPMLLLLLSY